MSAKAATPSPPRRLWGRRLPTVLPRGARRLALKSRVMTRRFSFMQWTGTESDNTRLASAQPRVRTVRTQPSARPSAPERTQRSVSGRSRPRALTGLTGGSPARSLRGDEHGREPMVLAAAAEHPARWPGAAEARLLRGVDGGDLGDGGPRGWGSEQVCVSDGPSSKTTTGLGRASTVGRSQP